MKKQLLGITGGVGMGKSTVGAFFGRLGVKVIDTDQIAHSLVAPGQPALAEIARRFGGGVLRPDGSLDRDQLAGVAFSDNQARADLEAILHPPIRAAWRAEVAAWRAAATRDKPVEHLAAVIIPLLLETHSAGLFDAIVCVACSLCTQAARLGKRGWSELEIQQRIQAQWPVEKKILQSDFLVWTDTTLGAVAEQVAEIARCCELEFAPNCNPNLNP